MTKRWRSKVSIQALGTDSSPHRDHFTRLVQHAADGAFRPSRLLPLLAATSLLMGPSGLGISHRPSRASVQSETRPPSQVEEKVAPARPAQDLVPLLDEVNVYVQLDARLFTVMAALNAAGYDDENNARSRSASREALRQGLSGLDPRLRERLHGYFRSHRLVGVDESGQIARYVALSFLISPPPQFAVSAPQELLPEDVITVLDFVPLLREFYSTANVAKLINKVAREEPRLERQFQQEAARVVFDTLNYLHTRPVLEWATRPSSRIQPAAGKATKKERDEGKPGKTPSSSSEHRTRSRHLYIWPNSLDARNSAYVRNDVPNGAREDAGQVIGDDYLVVVGPSTDSLVTAVRTALLRFVLEPLGGKYGGDIRSRSEPVRMLFKKLTHHDPGINETAFFLVTQSLAAAAEARIKILSAPATTAELAAEREEDALLGLCAQYERGAVLAFHFYEKLIPWERVGVDIAAYYEEMITSITFGREFDRATEVEVLRARLEKKRSERSARLGAPPVAEKIAAADALIQQRKYREARPVLEELLKASPESPRILFGLGSVLSGLAGEIDPQKASDPNVAQDQITENLLTAVKLFRQAAERATGPHQLWLASQARVAAGRILDFFGERAAAIEQYRLAAEIGPVPGGAFQAAREGLDHALTR